MMICRFNKLILSMIWPRRGRIFIAPFTFFNIRPHSGSHNGAAINISIHIWIFQIQHRILRCIHRLTPSEPMNPPYIYTILLYRRTLYSSAHSEWADEFARISPFFRKNEKKIKKIIFFFGKMLFALKNYVSLPQLWCLKRARKSGDGKRAEL